LSRVKEEGYISIIVKQSLVKKLRKALKKREMELGEQQKIGKRK